MKLPDPIGWRTSPFIGFLPYVGARRALMPNWNTFASNYATRWTAASSSALLSRGQEAEMLALDCWQMKNICA